MKISDEFVTANTNELTIKFQQRAYPMLQDIPNDVHDNIIQKLLSSTAAANNWKENASTAQNKQIERRIIE